MAPHHPPRPALCMAGIYGNKTLLWGISQAARKKGIFFMFWDVMVFLINAIIFFFVGASATNFVIRWRGMG